MGTPIELECKSCGAHLRAGSNLAGKTVPCPQCKQPVNVPDLPSPAQQPAPMNTVNPPPKPDQPTTDAIRPVSFNTIDGELTDLAQQKKRRERPATEKQKAFASDLGIEFDENISAREISRMIDAALDREEAMDQKELEPHLKTLRKCDEKDILTEMSHRGFNTVMICWQMNSRPCQYKVSSLESTSEADIRHMLINLLMQEATADKVNFDDVGAFLHFLQKCAAIPG